MPKGLWPKRLVLKGSFGHWRVMKAGMEAVEEGMGLREASRIFNIPVETLQRRISGITPVDYHPGPSTILTSVEEQAIFDYAIKMADMGFGLGREDFMQISYQIARRAAETIHLRMEWLEESGWRDF